MKLTYETYTLSTEVMEQSHHDVSVEDGDGYCVCAYHRGFTVLFAVYPPTSSPTKIFVPVVRSFAPIFVRSTPEHPNG